MSYNSKSVTVESKYVYNTKAFDAYTKWKGELCVEKTRVEVHECAFNSRILGNQTSTNKFG